MIVPCFVPRAHATMMNTNNTTGFYRITLYHIIRLQLRKVRRLVHPGRPWVGGELRDLATAFSEGKEDVEKLMACRKEALEVMKLPIGNNNNGTGHVPLADLFELEMVR